MSDEERIAELIIERNELNARIKELEAVLWYIKKKEAEGHLSYSGIRRTRDMVEGVLNTPESFHALEDDMSTEMLARVSAAQESTKEPQWWCCKAKFGEHEPTCKNYKGPR